VLLPFVFQQRAAFRDPLQGANSENGEADPDCEVEDVLHHSPSAIFASAFSAA
jgi:hypothetical protein